MQHVPIIKNAQSVITTIPETQTVPEANPRSRTTLILIPIDSYKNPKPNPEFYT